MSNWDNIRGDICEISILLNNAVCKTVGTSKLNQQQKNEIKKRMTKYGLKKIAIEIYKSNNREETAEKIAKKILSNSFYFRGFLRKIFELLLVVGLFYVLSLFFSTQTLINFVSYCGLGLAFLGIFVQDTRALSILILAIFGGCTFFFGFDSVSKIYAILCGILYILGLCFRKE